MTRLNEIKEYGETKDYQDLADFVEFLKVQGVKHFKNKELEIHFEKQEDKKVQSKTAEETDPAILEEMPADDKMLFASVEPLEFVEK